MCYTKLKVKTQNLSGHDSLLPRHKPSSCELKKLHNNWQYKNIRITLLICSNDWITSLKACKEGKIDQN